MTSHNVKAKTDISSVYAHGMVLEKSLTAHEPI